MTYIPPVLLGSLPKFLGRSKCGLYTKKYGRKFHLIIIKVLVTLLHPPDVFFHYAYVSVHLPLGPAVEKKSDRNTRLVSGFLLRYGPVGW